MGARAASYACVQRPLVSSARGGWREASFCRSLLPARSLSLSFLRLLFVPLKNDRMIVPFCSRALSPMSVCRLRRSTRASIWILEGNEARWLWLDAWTRPSSYAPFHIRGAPGGPAGGRRVTTPTVPTPAALALDLDHGRGGHDPRRPKRVVAKV